MTDDALSRAQELLDEVADDSRLIHLHSSYYVVAMIRDLVDALGNADVCCEWCGGGCSRDRRVSPHHYAKEGDGLHDR